MEGEAGHRLQEPGGEHCLSGNPGASKRRGRVRHRKMRHKAHTWAPRCPLWWSSREVKWELQQGPTGPWEPQQSVQEFRS